MQGDGAKTIYVSGQVGRPGEPRETQAQQATGPACDDGTRSPADLVKVTYYLPGYTPGNTGRGERVPCREPAGGDVARHPVAGLLRDRAVRVRGYRCGAALVDN